MTDSLTYAPSEGEEGDAKRRHEKEKTAVSTRGLLRTPSGARARFRALARAAKTHGIAATLLAGIPRASLVQVLDDDDEVLAEETNETNETNDERVS
jgi:hypothetical protein